MVLILVTVFSVDHAASFPPKLMHQFRIRIWVLNFKSCHRSRVPDIIVTESSSTSSWRWISCLVQSKTNLGTKKKKHELHFPPVEPTAYHLLAGVSTVTGTRPCQWQSPCTGRLYSLTTWTAVVHDSKTRAWTSARLTSKNMKQLEGITGIYLGSFRTPNRLTFFVSHVQRSTFNFWHPILPFPTTIPHSDLMITQPSHIYNEQLQARKTTNTQESMNELKILFKLFAFLT